METARRSASGSRSDTLHHTVVTNDSLTRLSLGEEGGVFRPVLVLWRRVVEILCGDDEGGEEDTVSGARHAFGGRWQSRP